MPYTKPYLSVVDQRKLLESRGMSVPDPAKAEEYLQRIGYYRLSAYCYPFRALSRAADGRFFLSDTYKQGTEFKHVTDLYAFDKGLRLLALDAIERIEISLRTEVALTLGRHDPFAHRDTARLDRKFVAVTAGQQSMYTKWLAKIDERSNNSKEEFAVHFRTKYAGSAMPIWIAVELLDFGPLSILLSGMRYSDLQAISKSYGGLSPHLIKSWARAINGVRNVCAHHARLWNKPLIEQPAMVKPGQYADLDHLAVAPGTNKRVYAAFAVMRALLREVNPRTKWAERLKAHVATFPQAPNVSISDAGFLNGWDTLPLWK